MERKIKYTVEKSKYDSDWILWQESSTECGICNRNVFRGKRNECIQMKNKLIKGEK